MYPQANIPVIQVSLDRNKSFREHYEFAKELADLRKRGVLILSSGNLVHNLRRIEPDMNAPVYNWAKKFDELVKQNLEKNNVDWFLNPPSSLFLESHPHEDHYLPILYTLGSRLPGDQLSFPIELFQNASISMRAVLFK